MKSKDQTLLEEAYDQVLDEGLKSWLKDKIAKTDDLSYSLATMGLSVTAALIGLGIIDTSSEYKQLSNVVRQANYEDYEKLKAAQDKYVYAMKIDKLPALMELNKLIKEYKVKYGTDEKLDK